MVASDAGDADIGIFGEDGPPTDTRTVAMDAGREAMAGSAVAMATALEQFETAGPAIEVLLATKGRVVVTGLGKSGLVGSKLAATFASTGTPSFFVHSGDALHGDAGMVTADDVLLALSNSGETAEVCAFAGLVSGRGVPVVALTGCGGGSTLARLAAATIDASVDCETDPYDLVPTASTQVTAALGDALAVALMVARGFGPEDFHAHHPGGALGGRLGAALASAIASGPAPQADVVVVGSFMMDLSIRAPRRPEPGETVIGSSFGMSPGGKGFNQAVAAARQGATTAMVGRLGDDEYGALFRTALADEGIGAHHVKADADEGTGVGVPLVEDSGENSITVVPRANHRVSHEDVAEAVALVSGAKVLLAQLELPVDVVARVVRDAHDAGVMVVLNPAPAVADLSKLHGSIDVIVPNETETALLTGCDPAEVAPADLARIVASTTGASVVLTLGAAGALVFDRDTGDVTTIEAHEVDAVDTVGAGDAFCGALAARLAAGDTLVEAATYASAAGALSVTEPGAAFSTPDSDAVLALLATSPKRPGRPLR